MKIASLIIYFTFLSHIVWCQVLLPKVSTECELDSVTQETSLDSVKKLISGRWVLLDARSPYKNKPTKNITEISISDSGEFVIYEHGKQISTSKMTIKFMYGTLRFTIQEPALSYFHFRVATVNKDDNSKERELYLNGIRLCGKKLVLYGFTSAGPSFIFTRI